MKIAYFGGDIFYHCMDLLAEQGHEIMALHVAQPGPGEYNFNQYICAHAAELNIPAIFSIPEAADIEELAAQGCEMIVVAGYPYKMPDCANSGIPYAINIHPSLLPEGAGPLPMPYAIIKGLEQTGVTIHKLSGEMDSGDIVMQEAYKLSGTEHYEELIAKNHQIAVGLLIELMDDIQTHWDNATAQEPKEGDYWPMPKPEEFVPDYSKSVDVVERVLRVHRFVSEAGELECIPHVDYWKEEHELEPGTYVFSEGGTYVIAAADGFVRFTVLTKLY